MYQQRFRHRNVLQTDGNNLRYEQYSNGGACSSSPSWTSYYSATPGINYASIDHMDDIIGNPPLPSQGLAGYKFNPMSKTKGVYSGSGDAGWLVQNVAFACDGYPTKHQTQFRRAGSSNASRAWAGLEIPLSADRVRLDLVGYPASEVIRLQDLAETAVLAQRGKYGEGNLYESLAEVNKTFGMLKGITDTARRIQDAIFFKKGGVERFRHLSKTAADQFLAIRYGFAPILRDLNAIHVGLEKPLGHKLITTKKSGFWDSVTNTAMTDLNDADTIVYSRNRTTNQKLKVTAMSLDNCELTRMNLLGLGWKDLLSVPWELKSHSFVVDWFVNLGDFLGSFVPDFGISNIGTCVIVEWERKDVVSYGYKGQSPAKVGNQTVLSATAPPPFTRTIIHKSRVIKPLSAYLRFKSDFKFDKLTRSLDALALFTQQASKIKASGDMSALDEIIKLRRRNPSQRGVRKAVDFRNLSD